MLIKIRKTQLRQSEEWNYQRGAWSLNSGGMCTGKTGVRQSRTVLSRIQKGKLVRIANPAS